MNDLRVVPLEYRVDAVNSALDYPICATPRAEAALFADESRQIPGTAAMHLPASTPRSNRMAEQ